MLATISAVAQTMGASALTAASPVSIPTFSGPNTSHRAKNFSLTSALMGAEEQLRTTRARAEKCASIASRDWPEPGGVASMTCLPAATSRTAASCAGYSVRSRAEAQATKASKTASSWRPAGTSSRSLSSSGRCTPSSLAAGTDSGPTLSGGGPLVVGLLGEEALELGADLVAGGQWLTARVEGIGAVP